MPPVMPGPPRTAPFSGPIVSGPYIGGSNPPTGGSYSGLPAQTTVTNPTPPGMPSTPGVVTAGAIRPTGPSSGFDPAYLQNLATAIGGLFSRPGGNLSFNPLGDLSDISSPALGFGNAASPGLPPTMLQDAINGLAFLFNPPPAPAPSTSGTNPTFGGGGGNIGNRRGNQLI